MNNKLIHTPAFLKGDFDFTKHRAIARAQAVNFIRFADAAQAVNAVFDHMDVANLTQTFTVLPPAPIASHYNAQPRVYSAQELSDVMGTLVSKHFPEETKGEYPTAWAGFKMFDAECRALGFERLGNGYFSIAFSHPSLHNKVLKVGFKKEDSAAAYIGFCRLHAGQAGIPTIHEVNRYDNCYTVVLDKYTKFEYFGRTSENKRQSVTYEAISASVCYGTTPKDIEVANFCDTAEQADDYVEHIKALIETGLKIHSFFKGLASFDCHDGNVMVNAEGTLMITDPVSFTKHITGWDALDAEGLNAQQLEAAKSQARAKRLQKAERRAHKPVAAKQRREWARYKKMREIKEAPLKLREEHQFGILNHFDYVDPVGCLFIPRFIRWRCGIDNIKEVGQVVRDRDVNALVAGRTIMADRVVERFLMG